MTAAPGEHRTFWEALQELVDTHPVKIDRPRGSQHPRYPNFVYPLDYGYLEETISADGGGVDAWLGTRCQGESKRVLELTGLLFTVDLLKQDIEAKLLLNCTLAEMQAALQASNTASMSAILMLREANEPAMSEEADPGVSR
jgi:inorganic pyrophosphatase